MQLHEVHQEKEALARELLRGQLQSEATQRDREAAAERGAVALEELRKLHEATSCELTAVKAEAATYERCFQLPRTLRSSQAHHTALKHAALFSSMLSTLLLSGVLIGAHKTRSSSTTSTTQPANLSRVV